MLGQLVAGQFTLEAAIADLVRDGAPASAIADSRAQLAALGALRQQLAGADARTLIALRGDIAATVAACQATAQQARAVADTETASNLANYAQSARAAVNDAMRGLRDFDRDLRFANAQDEADYFRREQERQSYIAAEQAKRTPEGDLNASGAAPGQMADAHAHGAHGPEFDRRVDGLLQTTTRLREALRQSGQSTQEFDDRLHEDLRRVMKSKGLSDAQIDARFAASPDPLEAARAYLTDNDVATVQRSVERESRQTDQTPIVQAAPPPSAAETTDPFAKLRSAGLAVSDHAPDAEFAHGVTASANKSTPSLQQG